FYQRRFRANDGQLHVLLGEVGQLLDGQHVDVDVLALGFGGRTGIARRDEYLLHPWVLRYLPSQGVFTSAAADDQYVHCSLPVEAGLGPARWISEALSTLRCLAFRVGWMAKAIHRRINDGSGACR